MKQSLKDTPSNLSLLAQVACQLCLLTDALAQCIAQHIGHESRSRVD